MIKKILPLVLLTCSGSLFGMCSIQPEVLLKKQEIIHGAPVQSVAWCCDFEVFTSYDSPWAAIGGYPGTDDAVVRVYNLEGTGACCTGNLVEKDYLPNATINTPQSFVYAVDWSCTCSSFLAVGCADGKVHIYTYDGEDLSFVVSYTHSGAVYDVKWLCDCCDGQTAPVLAIAGEKGLDGNEVCIIEVDEDTGTITKLDSALFGSTVYAFDWCCLSQPNASVAYLAAGGKSASSSGGCGNTNVVVYCYNCSTQKLSPITMMAAKPDPIYTVKWCCDPNQRIQRKLAVGGKRNETNDLIAQVFFLQHNRLFPLGSMDNGITGTANERVFAIDWNPECSCDHLTLGTGCKPDGSTCAPNLFVDSLIKCIYTSLFSTRFDDNITSLEWCYDEDNGRSYLLVGSEKDDWSHSDVCLDENGSAEVALYCAAFCGTQGVVPTPICQRRR